MDGMMSALLLMLLVMARMGGFFLSAPLFSARQIPLPVKTFLVIGLSLILVSGRAVSYPDYITSAPVFVAALVVETLAGYAIGLVTTLVFAAVQTAGQMMDMQMGFGIVNVLDPQSGIQLPLLGNFLYIISLLVFLGINGHHYLIAAIYQSYKILPIMGLKIDGAFIAFLIKLGADMFVLAIKIAAPLVAALFIGDVAMGFMSRTVPQMNIFVVGLPVKIAGGLFMLLIFIPVYIWLIQVVLENWMPYLDQALILLGR